jgi:hypothetical protein
LRSGFLVPSRDRPTLATATTCSERFVFDSTKLLANALGEHLALTYRQAFRQPRAALRRGDRGGRAAHDRAHRGERRALSRRRAHGSGGARRPGHPARPLHQPGRLAGGLAPRHHRRALPRHRLHPRRLCGRRAGRFVSDADGNTVALPRGASDAALAPCHVERSKIAVRERFGGHDLVDADRVARAIELRAFRCPTTATTPRPEPRPA